MIEIDNLVKRYGAATAINNISLSISEGEFLALLGPSGCGKTTLLRIIAGFVGPTSGEVRIGGKVMNDIPPYQRPVNTVFQNYALFPHMTVADNIAFGPRRQRDTKDAVAKRVHEVLRLVGMEDFGDRYPRQLSGGQQQRIALARAIVNRPKVLLLDEPLGALDLKLRKRMQVELKRLHEQLGITFVFVTHDQEEALAMADRIAVMGQGKLAQIGQPFDVYRQPVSQYVADFIGEANIVKLEARNGRLHLADTVLPFYEGHADGIVALMVRPENIKLRPPAEGWAALPATVRDKVFLGNTWRLHTVLADGQEVVASIAASEDVLLPNSGETIQLAWNPQEGKILEH